MKVLLMFDRALLAVAQRIADWTQTRIGWNCFHLVHVSAVCYVASAVWMWNLFGRAYPIIDAVFVLLMYDQYRTGKKSVRFGNGVATKNVLGYTPRHSLWRLDFMLIWFLWSCVAAVVPLYRPEIPGYIVSVHTLKATCFMVGVYFAACTPRPPSQSSLKKWFERLSSSVRTILQPVAEPSPVPV
jgi:hypothetical protein